MSINKDTKEAWRRNWETIDIEELLEVFRYPRVIKFRAIARPYIRGKILEGGCGLGPWVIQLTREGYNITGIDYLRSAIRRLKKYDPKLKVDVGDVRQLPYKPNSFDTYLSWGVIEHLTEGPERAIQEAYRVLRPKGRFLVIVPHLNPVKRINEIKRNPFLRRLFGKKPCYYQRYFRPTELKNKMINAGFKIELIKPVDHIFTLVEFSSIFRDKNTLDGENTLAVNVGEWLERFDWMASATFIVGGK